MDMVKRHAKSEEARGSMSRSSDKVINKMMDQARLGGADKVRIAAVNGGSE